MKNLNKKILLLLSIFAIGTLSAQVTLDKIEVKGNEFYSSSQELKVFRGLNTSDPDKLERDGHWNKAYFEEIKNWGANIVRFPVHPNAWEKRGQAGYLILLDEAIQWCTDLGLYVIIDWHSIGNLKTEMYQADMYFTTYEKTVDFWKTISARYGKNTTVAFYEIFNEPTTYNNTLGELSWEEWKKMNEDIIGVIRQNNGEGIPLVAGFNWAYDLTPIKDNPIELEGIAYVSHPYPQKRDKPWQEKWTEDWGFVKEKYPLILSEIGFCGPEDEGAHIPVISDESYGDAITKYADDKNISYVVWVFDPQWAPRLFDDWNFKPSRHGKYFKKQLQSYSK